MTNLAKFRNMTIDQLIEWLEQCGSIDDSPWFGWFGHEYCNKCEPIMKTFNAYSDNPVPYVYCELNGKCKFFPNQDNIPDNKQTIKMWLMQEADE